MGDLQHGPGVCDRVCVQATQWHRHAYYAYPSGQRPLYGAAPGDLFIDQGSAGTSAIPPSRNQFLLQPVLGDQEIGGFQASFEPEAPQSLCPEERLQIGFNLEDQT